MAHAVGTAFHQPKEIPNLFPAPRPEGLEAGGKFVDAKWWE